MEQISVLGIDLGKNTFYAHGVNREGQTVVRQRLSRAQLKRFMVRLVPCLIGVESCSGSTYWARLLQSYGHQVRIMPARYVKAYVKTNKNDWRDAEAICEAVQRPTMTFVPVKSVEQQEIQMLHRVRSRVVRQRTALANQIRGFLLEFGVAVRPGVRVLLRELPDRLTDGSLADLGDRGRNLLSRLHEELRKLDDQVFELDAQVKALGAEREDCRRLQEVTGIGPVTATALVAAAGDASEFHSARHMAAWLGLVPRQHSTGGTPRLLGISKRGDRYVRTLLIHCARAALRTAPSRDDRLSQWAVDVARRRGQNVAVVALANKLARIAWVVLARGERYAPRTA